MQDNLLKTITDLIKIPSVSGNVFEIANVLKYCRDFFKDASVDIREFKYDNADPVMLISNQKTDDFDLLVVGHLDVVPAKDELFSPKIDGNRLYARGAQDMKSQIAIGMYNLLYVLEKKLPIKMGILITTDEETTSNGIKAFVKNEKITSKIILDVDAGDLSTIIEKYKHSVGVKLIAKGLAGHSSRTWNGINAINKLMSAIVGLEKYFPVYSKENETPKDTWIDTMCVTSFNTEKTSNVIPDFAEAHLNFRLTEKIGLERLKEILQSVCSDGFCKYEVVQASCGCYMDANSPIIQDYKKIAEKIMGKTIKIEHMNGATDARMFAENSIIIMHSTNGANVHSDGEYIEIDSIYKLLEIQREFIDKALLKYF